MKRRILAVSLCALAAAAAWAKPAERAVASGGSLDLSSARLDGTTAYSVSGEWQFWWGQLVPPEALARGDAPAATGLAEMPRYWTEYRIGGEPLPARGAATYRLALSLPDDRIYGIYLDQMISAYRLYVNGVLVGGNGEVSADPDAVVPEFRPQALFFAPRDGMADLVLQIANGDYRTGGQWQPIVVGTAEAIGAHADASGMGDLFLLGAIVMIGLYNLAIFLFRTKERSPLWFGLFCLVMAARVAATGTVTLANAVRGFPWELQVKLELAIFHLGSGFFLLFFRLLFPREMPRLGWIPLLSIYGIYTALSLATPVSFFNRLVPLMQATTVLGLVFVLGALGAALARKRPNAGLVLFGFSFFALTALNDILYARSAIHTAYLLPAGLFVFIAGQAIALARSFSRSFSQVERLSESLTTVNRSLERFVPNEFLSFLDRRSIVDVKLGDQALRDMTILFSDIRAFTTMAETLSPQESFNFLNSYLERVGPIIRYHGGFIDKYIGDAIMALFPDSPSRAVEAAIAMQRAVRTFNAERSAQGHPPVQVGVGLHSGPAMLGIIGEHARLESTVISDTVNLASRIEGLTKVYRTDVLVSGTLVRALGEGCPFNFRLIDRLAVKGKSETSELYELLDACEASELAPYLASRDTFERGVALFNERRRPEALELFRDIARRNPADQAARAYIGRCSAADALP